MKKTVLSIFFLLLICSFVCSQQSLYVKNFDWMVKTFEENDAGFEYYFKQKGSEDYSRHIATYREKIQQAKSEQEYLSMMNEWLFYFRKGHIGFNTIYNNSGSLSEGAKDSIRALYKNEERIDLSKTEFERYLQENKNKVYPIEGIWSNNDYCIGIIQSKEFSNKFDAFILNADSVYWLPGQKKAELTLLSDSTFDVRYLMQNHSMQKVSAKFDGSSHNFLSMYGCSWIKIFPKANFTRKDSIYIRFATSKKPYIRKLSPKTIYLRIPSFLVSEKEAIDKVLALNDKVIRTTQNLIIDIRNGTGGSDYSSYSLIPYYYTQPIRSTGLIYRATELNARGFDEYGNKAMAKKMRENLGKYFESGKDSFLINSFTPSKFPIRVAVICNKENASADEAFLQMVRQSFKVKIFGRPTSGMLDFANVNHIKSPDGKYVLSLTMTERKEFTDYRVDDIGIQPDIFIDNSIKEEDWVDFVQSVIEKE